MKVEKCFRVFKHVINKDVLDTSLVSKSLFVCKHRIRVLKS